MEAREQPEHLTSRRSFLVKGAAVGAASLGAGRLLVDPSEAFASGGLTKGDAAVLRFLAAAEIIETDLWQQYNELAGIQDSEVPGGSGNPAYSEAVAVLDEDMDQYIHDNTDDEISHAAFINAYLKAHGAQTVNLDRFRTLPSSKATGAQQIGPEHGVPSAQIALAWLLHKPGVTPPIVGATKPGHLEDALAAEQLSLSDEEITRLEEPYVPHAIAGH
jgi:hypothetical protein